MDQTSPLAAPTASSSAPGHKIDLGNAAPSTSSTMAENPLWPAQTPQSAPAPFAPPPTAPPPYPSVTQSVNNLVNVNVGGPTVVFVRKKTGPNLVVRAIWFVFFGSWLGALTVFAAHVATVTIIGIPLGFWLYNRVPSIATLRPRTEDMNVRTADGVTFVETGHQTQLPLWQRMLYFIFIGWWLTLVWYALAVLIAVGIITLPISVLMLDRIGGIATLHKH